MGGGAGPWGVRGGHQMNPLLPIAILALVQGITEFLPVSSSGHLVLTWKLFDEAGLPVSQAESDRLLLDIAVHVGTLGAVILYYWRDVGRLIGGFLNLLRFRLTEYGRLVLLLILATIPTAAAGLLLEDFITGFLRSAEVVAWASIGFGILLWVVDRTFMTVRRMFDMRLPAALFVGLAQVLALIPGTSRAGITMTAGRALGMERTEAARFSMLLSIPTILGAGLLLGKKIYDSGNLQVGVDAAIGAGLAFISALIAIALMMAWLRRATFTPFVIYRVLLGAVILYFIYVEGVSFGVEAPAPAPTAQ